MPRPLVSVVLPAYNEVGSLHAVVADATTVLANMAGHHEILIVDDGSRDGTAALADELAAANDLVRVVHHPSNRGFGGAMASCFEHARGEWVFLAPADGQIGMDVLPRFVRASADAEIIAGRRSTRADGLRRLIASRVFHAIARTLLGLPLSEFSSCFLFRRDTVSGPWESRPDAAAILPEVLFRARRRHLRIRSLEVEHFKRTAGEEKGGSLAVAFRTLIDLIRLSIVLRLKRRGGQGSRDR